MLLLLDVTPFSLLWESVSFTKLAILLLLTKFARFNVEAELCVVNLLNSGVVIYFLWLWSVIFFSISQMFVL